MKSSFCCGTLSRLIALLILVGLPACGPGPAGVGVGGSGSDSLHAVPDLTGVIQTSGSVMVDTTVFAGDRDAAVPGLNTRGFYTFDLSTIPAGKSIRSAKLKAIQSAVKGSPYTDLGNLVVDHLIYGTSLDSADYNLPSLSTAFAVLSDSSNLGSHLANVFQQVRADLQAGRTISQFRIRFSDKDGDNDGLEDNIMLNDIDDDPPPIIILTFN